MADLSKIKLNGTEYDLKDAIARNLLHIINIELTENTYQNLPVGQLNCSQEELKNYYENGLCILKFEKGYCQIAYYDNILSQMFSHDYEEILDVYHIAGCITIGLDGENNGSNGLIIVRSNGMCLINSNTFTIPYIIDDSYKGIYNTVTGELDISNIVINSDLAAVATSGNYNDLTNKPTIPEDKLFLVNVTMNSMTSGTSDKSSAEIASAVNAGKLPIVKTGMGQMSMMATLVNIEETQENGETYYFATFMYNDENASHTSSPSFVTKAVMIIIGTNVTLQVKPGSYITDRELNEKGYLTSYTETDPTVPAWAKQTNKPTYTASEVGALPSTYTAPVTSVNGQTGAVNLTIPAAQVQSDWNAISGMGVILNKPNVSTFMVKGTDYVTAGQKSGTTLGNKATAEGGDTTASGNYSHAEGGVTTASGDYSHAEGKSTTASGIFSHAEGYYTDASRDSSHAEGHNTTASGVSSHAEGTNTTASGNYSHAEGKYTTAQGRSQHVFGEYNILDTTGTTTTRGQYVEIVGNGTSSARSNARTLDWSGNEVLAGKLTIGTAPTANMDVTTKQYVDNAIITAIGGINQFEVAVVIDLPTANIDAHTIYFKSNSSSGNNVYDEYIYINNNWELIGSTQVDLSNYLQTSDIAAWAKAATKPTYTASEVGALPDTTVIPAAQVNSDWNATSGIAQILNKPNIPEAETDANVEDMLDDFNLDYTSNTTNSNYANGVNF